MSRVISAVCAFILVLATSSAVSAAPGWSTAHEISDVTMAELASAVDSAGHVHVVGSTHSRNDPLYYLTNSSGSWSQAELVQSPRKGAITSVGVSVDADDSVWIVYQRWSFWNPCFFSCPPGGPSTLDGNFLINNVGGTWSAPARLPADILAIRWSFAVRDGTAHFAYDKAVRGNFSVRYATDASGTWQTRRIGPGWGPHLELGPAQDPWVAYTAPEYPGGVVVAHSNGGSSRFVKSRAPGTASAIETAVVDGLGLNRSGRPVAIFDRYEEGEGYWTYWVRLGRDGWTAPRRLLNMWTTAFDMRSNRMHLLYELGDAREPEGLYYATSTGRLARTTRIDGSTRHVEDAPSAANSLVVDDDGRPHVVFAVPYDEDRDGTWYLVGPTLD